MLLKLLGFVLAGVAMASPNLQAPNIIPRNCTFDIEVTETCDLTGEGDLLATWCNISKILSLKGDTIVNQTFAYDINRQPLKVNVDWAQEVIAGVLSVARPNNTITEFAWTYGPGGGRPVTEKWTEDKDGKDGRYGCDVLQDWFGDGWCDTWHPMGERMKVMNCWFKCSPGGDGDL